MLKPSQANQTPTTQHNTKCFSCGNPSQRAESRWCEEHWYPYADEEYQAYLDLLDEGHTRAQAMVISGIMGADEI